MDWKEPVGVSLVFLPGVILLVALGVEIYRNEGERVALMWLGLSLGAVASIFLGVWLLNGA